MIRPFLALLPLLVPTLAQAQAVLPARGEPIAVSGMLSHCEPLDDGTGCTVLADGLSYVASSFLGTDPDLLLALRDLGLNVPVTVAGKMLEADGTEVLVTFERFAAEGTDPWAETRAALQGFWTSIDDPAYQLAILGSSFEEFTADAAPALAMMQFTEQCPDGPEGPAFHLVSRDGSDTRCVVVGEVLDDSLELLVDGAPHPLGFTREK